MSSSVLYCRCSAGGTATESSFTAGMAANTWVQIDVKKNGSGNWEFYHNGTLIQTITTNKPTTQGMYFGFFLSSSSNGAQSIDYMGFKSATLTRY